MILCRHRVNTISELLRVPKNEGVEIDLRSFSPDGLPMLAHDAALPVDAPPPDIFPDWLDHYDHAFLILNVKTEGLETRILNILNSRGITRFFFLDCSGPVIWRMSAPPTGETRFAVRYSAEWESSETALALAGRVEWVWVDRFTPAPGVLPISLETYVRLKQAGFKLCLVSPELQGSTAAVAAEIVATWRTHFRRLGMAFDMVCTKNPAWWEKPQVQVIIPMSGQGRRFREAGYRTLKPMIDVLGKPMVAHVADLFPGEPDVRFICSRALSDEDAATLRQIRPATGAVQILPTASTEGPVGAVSQVFDTVDDEAEVIVSYCDYGTDWDYAEFLADARRQGAAGAEGAIAVYRGFHPHTLGPDYYGYAMETEPGSLRLLAIREKRPFTADRRQEWTSNGTYYFRSGRLMKHYFRRLMAAGDAAKIGGEYYVSTVYNRMVADGLCIRLFPIERMLQWGTPTGLEDYLKWADYFMRRRRRPPPGGPSCGTLIMPMAGAGSRFTAEAETFGTRPKPLLDLEGQPMFVRACAGLPPTARKVFVCLDSHRAEVEPVLEEVWGKTAAAVSVPAITDGQATTTAIGLREAGVADDEPILVSACDNGVVYDAAKWAALVGDPAVDVIVWSFRANTASTWNPDAYAWMLVDAAGQVRHVSCKKYLAEVHNLRRSHVIIGTMFFRKARYFREGYEACVREGRRTKGEFYVDDVVNSAIKAGLSVRVFEADHYLCWGTPDDYRTYEYWRGHFQSREPAVAAGGAVAATADFDDFAVWP